MKIGGITIALTVFYTIRTVYCGERDDDYENLVQDDITDNVSFGDNTDHGQHFRKALKNNAFVTNENRADFSSYNHGLDTVRKLKMRKSEKNYEKKYRSYKQKKGGKEKKYGKEQKNRGVKKSKKQNKIQDGKGSEGKSRKHSSNDHYPKRKEGKKGGKKDNESYFGYSYSEDYEYSEEISSEDYDYDETVSSNYVSYYDSSSIEDYDYSDSIDDYDYSYSTENYGYSDSTDDYDYSYSTEDYDYSYSTKDYDYSYSTEDYDYSDSTEDYDYSDSTQDYDYSYEYYSSSMDYNSSDSTNIEYYDSSESVKSEQNISFSNSYNSSGDVYESNDGYYHKKKKGKSKKNPKKEKYKKKGKSKKNPQKRKKGSSHDSENDDYDYEIKYHKSKKKKKKSKTEKKKKGVKKGKSKKAKDKSKSERDEKHKEKNKKIKKSDKKKAKGTDKKWKHETYANDDKEGGKKKKAYDKYLKMKGRKGKFPFYSSSSDSASSDSDTTDEDEISYHEDNDYEKDSISSAPSSILTATLIQKRQKNLAGRPEKLQFDENTKQLSLSSLFSSPPPTSSAAPSILPTSISSIEDVGNIGRVAMYDPIDDNQDSVKLTAELSVTIKPDQGVDVPNMVIMQLQSQLQTFFQAFLSEAYPNLDSALVQIEKDSSHGTGSPLKMPVVLMTLFSKSGTIPSKELLTDTIKNRNPIEVVTSGQWQVSIEWTPIP